MAVTQRRRRPAAETRAEILDAAETCFAERGFEATRLEDVAERVGVRRAALFYYFKDKRELQEATLGRLAGDLMTRLQRTLSEPHELGLRLADGVVELVDFCEERPAFPRLVLRLASEAGLSDHPDARAFAEPFFAFLDHVLAEGERAGVLRPLTRDPVQLASTIAGSTVFYMAAMPAFTAEARLGPRDDAERLRRRDAMLAVLRGLMGFPTEDDDA